MSQLCAEQSSATHLVRNLRAALITMVISIVIGLPIMLDITAPDVPGPVEGKIIGATAPSVLPAETVAHDDTPAPAPQHKSLVRKVVNHFKITPDLAKTIVSNAVLAAEAHELPPTLVLAVIARESSFNPRAVNDRDFGLMQVNAKWHADKIRKVGGLDMMFVPKFNLRVGTKILKDYVDAAEGSFYGGLRRYNGLGKANNYPSEVLAFKRMFEA